MKKEDLNIDGLYKIQKNDLIKCADVAARAFLDDESSKFLLSSKLTYKSLFEYYSILYKATYNKMYMFAESDKIEGFIIVAPVKNSQLSLWDCIKAGSIRELLSLDVGILIRSLKYEQNCIRIRNKIASKDTWYIFQFGVHPDRQGCGLGSKTMKPFLCWLDSKKAECYLETQKAKNVDMYNHFGFSLKSIDKLPKRKEEQFAMLRVLVT